MIFTIPGSLSGCRDSQGRYVPVPRGFGQLDPPAMPLYQEIIWTKEVPNHRSIKVPDFPTDIEIAPDPGSYQEIWDFLRSTCVSIAGEDACSRLLGHTPFVCPVEEPRKRSFLIPLLIGAAIGKMIL